MQPMQVQEKSGESGVHRANGEALRGHEPTAVWASPGDLGGTEAGRADADTNNKVALTVGAVLIAALVLLCFRLAYSGIQDAAKTKGYTVETPDTGGANPAAPRVAGGVDFHPAAPAGIPVQAPAPRRVVSASTLLPTPPKIVEPLFDSAAQRAQVIALLRDCRSAYDASGELAPKWSAFAGEAFASTADKNTFSLKETDAVRDAPAATSPPATDWSAVDMQMEAITMSVGFATRPALYPPSLQDTAAALGHEMRTFLQTARFALTQTDPAERSAVQARADAHRQKAATLLSALESAVQTGTTAQTR